MRTRWGSATAALRTAELAWYLLPLVAVAVYPLLLLPPPASLLSLLDGTAAAASAYSLADQFHLPHASLLSLDQRLQPLHLSGHALLALSEVRQLRPPQRFARHRASDRVGRGGWEKAGQTEEGAGGRGGLLGVGRRLAELANERDHADGEEEAEDGEDECELVGCHSGRGRAGSPATAGGPSTALYWWRDMASRPAVGCRVIRALAGPEGRRGSYGPIRR